MKKSYAKILLGVFITALAVFMLPATLVMIPVSGAIAGYGSHSLAGRFCEFEDPRIIVKLGTRPVKYFRGNDSRYLTSSQGHTVGSILGLAYSGFAVEVRPEFEQRQIGERVCTAIKNIKVLWIVTPDIHIASDYKRGSCEYSAILAHEQDHVRRTRKFVKKYAPEFKKEVGRIMKTMPIQAGPMPSKHIDQAQNDMVDMMFKRLDSDFFRGYMPILNKSQQEIDTPESYAKVFARCDNW